MAMEITSNYSGVYGSTYTARQQAAKREETQEAAATKQSPSTGASSEDYLSKLAKLAPSVKIGIGNGLSTAKSGLTLTINPALLEKMQNDPEQERETMELIRGVESATKMVESFHKANGATTVYRHGYIDENGKFHSSAYVVKKDKLNEKLRKEAQENFEKQIERVRENTRKKTEQLAEKLKERADEKKEEKAEGEKAEKTDQQTSRVERLLNEKVAASQNGLIYFNDSDFRELLKAIREDNADAQEQPAVGVNLDLRA